MPVLSERLSLLLSKNKMNQKELSAKVGITESAMSHYINGSREPRCTILLRIAQTMNVTTDYLLGNDVPLSEVITHRINVTDVNLLEYFKKHMNLSDCQED